MAPPPEDSPDLEQSLRDIATALAGLTPVLQEIADSEVEQLEKADGLGKINKKSYLSLVRQAKAIPIVGKAVTMGSQEIVAAVKGSMQMQEKALSRGLNLTKVMEQQSATTTYLTEGITGYGKALEIGWEQFAAGSRRSNKATDLLLAQTKLTGGNSLKLMKEMQGLTAGTLMSNEQQTNLHSSIQSLSQRFGMTTEELVGAIGELKGSMTMYSLLNIGPEILEAGAAIGAALGPEMAKSGTKFLDSMLSAEGAITAGMLGVSADREALLKGEGDATRNALMMVESAGRAAHDMYQSYLQGSGDPAIAYKAVSDALGPAMAEGAMVYKGMKEEADRMGMTMSNYSKMVAERTAVSKEFATTWQSIKDEAFSPLIEKITQTVGWITEFVKAHRELTVRIVQVGGILAIIAGLLIAGLAVQKAKGIAKSVKGALGGDAAQGAGKAAGKAGGGFGKSLSSLGKGLANLGKGIGGGVGALIQKTLLGIGQGLSSLGKGLGGGIEALISKSLRGIAKGVGYFANPKVLLGALGILAVGAALIPLAFALTLVKDVGIGAMLAFAGALVVFGLAAVGFGFIAPLIGVGSLAILGLGLALIPLAYSLKLIAGVGIDTMFAFAGALVVLGVTAAGLAFISPFIIMGSIAIAALGLALLPLAMAIATAAPGLEQLAVVMTALAGVSITSLFLLGPALFSVAAGLSALSAGGAVSGFFSMFTKGDDPIEKLVKMGKAAKHINKLVDSLNKLPAAINATATGLGNLSMDDVEKMGKMGEAVSKGGTASHFKKNRNPYVERILQREYADTDRMKLNDAKMKAGIGPGLAAQSAYSTMKRNSPMNLYGDSSPVSKAENIRNLQADIAESKREETLYEDEFMVEVIKEQTQMLELVLNKLVEGNDQRADGLEQGSHSINQRNRQIANSRPTPTQDRRSMGQGLVGNIDG